MTRASAVYRGAGRDIQISWGDLPGQAWDPRRIVRLPANGSNVVFFYRKDLFAKEGLSVPRTWADVVKAGQRLTKGGVYGLGFAGKNGNTQLFNELSYWIGQAGGDAIHLKTSAARTTLKFIYDMLHTYKIMQPDTVTNDYTALQTSFEIGHIAMWPTWGGILGPLLPGAKAGNTTFPVYGKTDIALPPRGPKDNSSITASWGWSISKFSKNKDMAAKFITYATMPQSEVTLALTGSEPARVSVLSNPTVHSSLVEARYAALYDAKTTVRSRPITAQAQRISDAMEAVINRYLNKQISLDAAINEAQQRSRDKSRPPVVSILQSGQEAGNPDPVARRSASSGCGGRKGGMG